MARAGMSDAIRRLRQMTETSENDYTLVDTTYWGDDHLQAKLDEHRVRHVDVALRYEPDYLDSDYVYTRYAIPRSIGNAVEGTAGGSAIFRLTDSTGTVIAASNYTFNERDLAVTFSADQEGSARYWSGYAYDLQAAAREIWLAKAAHVWQAINFSADFHKFDREALYKHCIDMAKLFGYEQGMQAVRMLRTDLLGSSEDAERF